MSDLYAVIGNPVEHSKSPLIHATFAQQTGQNIEYRRILAPLGGFAASVEQFRYEGGRGANVTVPFKEDACLYSHLLTARAQLAGAVNTLSFSAGGEVWGDTTDGIGLTRDITINLGVDLRGKHILLLGAGGAARGVIQPLLEHAPALLAIANRTEQKALALSSAFPQIIASGYGTLAGQSFDIVINATASSLAGERLPLPEGIFAAGALAYEMMYGRETPFMQFARTQGAAIVADGLGMLVEQAAESFFIWRGVKPQTAPVIARLRG
jgi:shikimate dehydrogenase